MDIVEGIRKALQDLLIPEFKALQAEVSHLRQDVNQNSQELRELHKEMNERFEKLARDMDLRFEKLTLEMNARFEAHERRFATIEQELVEIKLNQTKMMGVLEGISVRLEFKERVDRLERIVDAIAKKLELQIA